MLRRLQPVIACLLFSSLVAAGKGDPPRIDDKAQTKFRIPVGTKAFKLVCPILPSEQNVMVQWSRNGEPMDLDDKYKIARDNREVRFKNLKFEDSGKFECQVVNGFGHVRIEFILQVYDPATESLAVNERVTMAEHNSPPYWLDDRAIHARTSLPIRVHVGGKLELNCAARGNPVPELRWFKNDELIPSDGPIDSAVMIIDAIREEDAGSYRCEVGNKNGYKQATFKVMVGDFFDADKEEKTTEDSGPIPIIQHPLNLTVSAGRTAQFLCKAKAEDTPLTKVLIRWLKELTPEEKDRLSRTNATVVQANGKSLMVIDDRQFPSTEIEAGSNYFTNRLIIPSTEKHDEGRYICVVTDAAGRIVYRTAELYVLRGLKIGDLHLTPSFFWWIAIPVVFVAVVLVIFAIMYLKASQKQQAEEDKDNKPPPPPPRIPRPVTPSQDQVFPQHQHAPMGHYFDQPQSPLLMPQTMYHHNGRVPTMDRMHTPHRLHRGMREEDMLGSPHFHHNSPQSSPMYWGNSKSSNQPLLMTAPQMIDCPPPQMMERGHHTLGYYPHHHPSSYAPSSNYRTLELQYCRDPHPSLYSSEYADHSPFVNISRTHDL